MASERLLNAGHVCGDVRLPTDSKDSANMQPKKQHVLVLEAPRQVRLAEMPLPSPGPQDVVVKSLFSTFKHGSEMMAYFGRSPFAERTFNPHLRLFEARRQPGSFYPRPMGNMVVGTVEWAGSEVQDLERGQRVFAWAPISDVHVLPAGNVRALGDLLPQQALCIDPAVFALGGLIDGAIERSECVLVTGLGAIGLLVVQYCKSLGAKVLAASTFASRRKLAEAYDAAEIYDSGANDDLARLIKQRTGGVDAAIECSGSLANLSLAIRATRQCGRVVCIGFYGPADSSINLGEEFFHNRISLLASLPAHTWNNPVRGPSPLYAKDLQARVARDFQEAKITPCGILDPTVPFDEAHRAVRLIAEEPHRVVKVLLDHSPQH
jgi:threonine dehydrogenase-like Zn-dependent dehydrogenase